MKHWIFLLGWFACWHCTDGPRTEKLPPGYGNISRNWLNSAWVKLGDEPVLSEKYLGHDIIRLMYASSLDIPSFIILHRQGDSVWIDLKRLGRITNSLDNTTRHYPMGPDGQADMLLVRRVLSQSAWQRMDSLLTADNFWQMAPNAEIGIDGRTFWLEAHYHNRYHIAGGWQPDERVFSLCLYLSQLAGLKNENDHYGYGIPSPD